MAVKRLLPTRNGDSDNVQVPTRASAYLDAYVQPLGGGNWSFADEGSYYVATNATLATGIAGHAAPVVADTDTKPLLHLFNGTVYNLIPDYLFLEITAAGTGGTIQYTTIYIDNKGSTARSSGGTQITAFNATRSAGGGPSTTGLVMYFGAVVAAMTSSVKVGQQIAREVIPVVQDTLVMKFGGPNGGAHAALTTAGTATNHLMQHFGPLCIGPGGNLNISQIRPSQSAAASYQFEFGFWLR
jgi:hypothetical protein